jgi:hypothetical protein
VFGGKPGDTEVRELFIGWLYFRGNSQQFRLPADEVAFLNQHLLYSGRSSVSSFSFIFARLNRRTCCPSFPVFGLSGLPLGRTAALLPQKPLRMVPNLLRFHRLRKLDIDLAVYCYDTAECACYVALVCLAVSDADIIVNSAAAGIEMFDNNSRRLFEFLHKLEGRVGVQQIIETYFGIELHNFARAYTGFAAGGKLVKRRRLMRIFAVTKR